MLFRAALVLVGVMAVAGCSDGFEPREVPIIDAGTGRCEDDYAATVRFCVDPKGTTPEEGEEKRACWRTAIDRYEVCLGPNESCRNRCILAPIEYTDAGTMAEQQAAANARCFAQCPEAGP